MELYPRLMVIENNPDRRRRMASALARTWPGAPLITCPADDLAIARARHWRPRVIVADWDEPADNAIELSRALRCYPELSETRVAALAFDGKDCGDDEVVLLHKPAGARPLRLCVQGLLRAAETAEAAA